MSKKKMAETVADIRARTVAAGRPADSIKFVMGICIVTAASAAEAQSKLDAYRKVASDEAILAHLSAGIGIDLSKYDIDEPIRYEKTDANQTVLETLTRLADKVRPLREVVQEMAVAGKSAIVAGMPALVCDELESWMETGIDGFMVGRVVHPETFSDFIGLVVPELQRRGLHKKEYQPGSLREKFGLSATGQLPSHHIGASYRRAPAHDLKMAL
jgi:alkanesulfonate monooxygenase SsuD/methylene tetrahydromethanopterin reductase-like flavin-dependent oxidoreductase (luciferase family)